MFVCVCGQRLCFLLDDLLPFFPGLFSPASFFCENRSLRLMLLLCVDAVAAVAASLNPGQ